MKQQCLALTIYFFFSIISSMLLLIFVFFKFVVSVYLLPVHEFTFSPLWIVGDATVLKSKFIKEFITFSLLQLIVDLKKERWKLNDRELFYLRKGFGRRGRKGEYQAEGEEQTVSLTNLTVMLITMVTLMSMALMT